jgi:2-methylcitrate dehydratase PrpD
VGPTRTLCRYAVDTKFDDLPSEVVEKAKICILNILGVEFGGYKTRIGQLHVQLAKDFGGGIPEATIVGDGTKVSVPLAAYANGNLGFALDYEDMIRYILHAGYISVAASLAVGEKVKASGKDFITAIVLAYEVTSRIAMSMQPTPEHGSKVWGEQYTPFAAVVPAGKLLGLDEEQMDHCAVRVQVLRHRRRNETHAGSEAGMGLDVHGGRGSGSLRQGRFRRRARHSRRG